MLIRAKTCGLAISSGPLAKILRGIIVQEAREIEKSKQQHGSVLITLLNTSNGQPFSVKADIEIVHNSWSLELFGAIIRIENLPYKLKSGEGNVDMLVSLYEVQDDAKISESMLRVSGVNPFKGAQINQFISDFNQAFVSDWNA